LDQGRKGDVNCYAEGRVNVYKSFLNGKPLPDETSKALENLVAWQHQSNELAVNGMANLLLCSLKELEKVEAGGQ
jgi:hypothetical protein